jgi:hypothetical protein
LVETASGADERREFQRLERSFTELADNAQWMIETRDKTIAPAQSTAQRYGAKDHIADDTDDPGVKTMTLPGRSAHLMLR